LPPHPKVEGSSLTTATNAGREKKAEKCWWMLLS
jgi:hypothetical protein